jgi:hypothetical protein
MIVEELVARIGLDFRGAAAAAQAVKSIDGIRAAALGVGGVFAALGASMTAATVSTAKAIDDFADFGETVGASVETLQTLTFAAEQAGGSFGDVQVGLRTLANVAGNAAQGNEAAAESFARLGARVTDTNGKVRGTEDILNDVANGLQRLPAGAARVNAAMDVLGRGAVKLIPALSNGREGLQDLRAEAERIGFVLDKQTTKRFQKLGDNLDMLGARATGLKNLLGKAFLPFVENQVGRLNKFLDENANNIASFFGRLSSLVGGPLELLGRAVGVLVEGLAGLGKVSPILSTIIIGGGLMAAAFLSPVIAIGVLTAAVAILAEDFNAFFNGKDSAIGRAIASSKTLTDVLTTLRDLMANITTGFGDAAYRIFSGDTTDRDQTRANIQAILSKSKPGARLVTPAELDARADQARLPSLRQQVSALPFGSFGSAAQNEIGRIGANVTTNINVSAGAGAQEIAEAVRGAGQQVQENITDQIRSRVRSR